ncbi:MAG TPA: saccharopine dehydrogenase [Spongiibacteraceae bacterium]|nr:saccharopine dehydrogenase [Spongiibacteraceae bacterium]MBN51640.1 saccharopine dehydrogenase [Spongiibacteraceae bacterium]HCS28566.1 saccharopine dehydrogenase [Spongiibacteraceae bacterium]|tara:strand:+ start:966 stop:2099 length:1134 start_codon:yes stop_codon:yes gene_type:complete
MKSILVLGAGKIGIVIADMLAGSGDYAVTLADNNPLVLQKLKKGVQLPANYKTQALDVTDANALEGALTGKYAVISALPYALTLPVGRAAKACGAHYFDLTEDVTCTRAIKELAQGAEQAFLPQCGLAPGFVSIVAHALAQRFDRLDKVQMRVGALPKYPSNALKYNLTWSTEGLINEYCRPCEAIVGGQPTEVMPLEQLEHFSLDGLEYEAFNTSGGLGTLCETLQGQVNELNYRSVRYPGHRDIAKMLLQDLKLSQRQDLLKEIFETALPGTDQDVVLIFVTVSGHREGRYLQETYANKVFSRAVSGFWLSGNYLSAIQVTTASSVCASLDLLRTGVLPQKGFVKQEQIALEDFLANRFGAYYQASSPSAGEEVA